MNDLTTSVIIIGDHPLFRKAATHLTGREGAVTFIGEGASGEEGGKLYARLRPDFILLDLNMMGMDGLAILRALREGEARRAESYRVER